MDGFLYIPLTALVLSLSTIQSFQSLNKTIIFFVTTKELAQYLNASCFSTTLTTFSNFI